MGAGWVCKKPAHLAGTKYHLSAHLGVGPYKAGVYHIAWAGSRMASLIGSNIWKVPGVGGFPADGVVGPGLPPTESADLRPPSTAGPDIASDHRAEAVGGR